MRLASCILYLLAVVAISSGEYVLADAKEKSESPRLKTLQDKVQAGDRDALESFWQAVTEQGTPLVEPVQGDEEHVVLTFLWRGEEGNEKRYPVFCAYHQGQYGLHCRTSR